MAGITIPTMQNLTDEPTQRKYPEIAAILIRFQSWLALSFIPRVQAQAPVAGTVQASAQTASLGTTAIVALANGVYRVSVYVRVVVADGVSSAINFSVLFTDGGIAVTATPLAAATGNTTGTVLAWTGIIRADAGTPISLTTTYVSGGGGPNMAYDVATVAEGAL